MNYFEVWMGDYLRKTMHLDSTEHGVYFMLMVAYYSDEKPLPNDLKKLCRICKAHSQKEKDAVAKILEEFFQLSEDGCYHNSKCDSIIERFRIRSEVASESGKKGGRPPKSNEKPQTESEPFISEKPNESSLNPKPQSLNPNGEEYINTPEVLVTVIKEEPIDFELSELLFSRIQVHDPKAKKPNLSSWAKHIRLLRVKDEREPEEIRNVIEWCQNAGNFWQPNIQSTSTLREKFSRLVQQMQNDFIKAAQITNATKQPIATLANSRESIERIRADFAEIERAHYRNRGQ